MRRRREGEVETNSVVGDRETGDEGEAVCLSFCLTFFGADVIREV